MSILSVSNLWMQLKIFHIFQINEEEVKKYTVHLAFDLRVPSVVILPNQKKVKISYYPTYSDPKTYVYDLQLDKTLPEEDGLTMWGNEELQVVLKKGGIHLREKVDEGTGLTSKKSIY